MNAYLNDYDGGNMANPVRISENGELVLSGSVTVRLAGEFARAARQVLEQHRDAVIDCTDAEYLDCSIWQQFALLAAELRADGKALRVMHCSPQLERDGRLVGVWQHLILTQQSPAR